MTTNMLKMFEAKCQRFRLIFFFFTKYQKSAALLYHLYIQGKEFVGYQSESDNLRFDQEHG